MALLGPFGPRRGRRVNGHRGGRKDLVTVIDLGSSSITCLIARRAPDDDAGYVGGLIDVVGIGRAPSRGVKAGAVIDMDAASADIRAAVEEAEQMAGAAVHLATVGFGGGQPTSHSLFAETVLDERPIDDRDLRRALDGALAEFGADERLVLHAIPLSWSIDAHRGVRDPRGMFGRSLGVEVHVVSAAAGPVRNLDFCLSRAGLVLHNVVATPYAAGLSTLVEDETDLGVTLIDLGASLTTAAVFIDSALVHVDALPVGAGHISADLARGLSTPLADAERIKRRWGSLVETAGDDCELIDCPQLGEARSLLQAPRSVVRDIIRPRVEETVEIMRDRLAAAGVLRAAGPRVVLTGGGSRLGGVARVAAEIMGKRVRVARPFGVAGLPEGDDGPEMAAAVGLLHHVFGGPAEACAGPFQFGPELGASRKPMAPMRQAAAWLKENF
ncbi:MAG: cell division protein FtsA [Maricaulaceae bacterium]|jgi:cell division protein FtsA